jgi:hypothetical protein
MLLVAMTAAWSQQTPARHEHGMAGMPDQHMQEMKAQVETMRATLDKMKANLVKIKDPALMEQSQADVDLWQAMVKHMEGMVAMMSDSHESGMMEHGMGCCAKMAKSEGSGCCGANKCMKPNDAAPPAPGGSGS